MADDRASIAGPGRRVNVLLPLPLRGAYDYLLDDDLDAETGSFVVVPLGQRLLAGVIWGEGGGDEDGQVAESRLRYVEAVLPVPPMPEVTRRFIEWLADYTCAAPGSVLRMGMNVPAALRAPKPRLAYELAGPPPERMTSARARVIELLTHGPPMEPRDLANEAGVSSGVIRGLVETGTLAPVTIPDAMPDWRAALDATAPILNDTQRVAVADIAAVLTTGFSATLLDGVTGAGKTEVYFEAIAATIARGRQVAVLLPEIALTAEWLDRFEARFGARPTQWHSDLGSGERRRHWRAVAENRAKVIVGARSALFLPYADLGLIIVDEEHDPAFKQEDGVIYHARDMAVARASLGEIPILLVSATPSLESLRNVELGRYRHVGLPERAGGAALPEVHTIDMRRAGLPAGRWLSPELVEAAEAALGAGEQVMLFLNRRGYAPLTLCRTCGHRFECPHCSAWLVEHRFAGRLQCHHCGHSVRQPKECPSCNDSDSFAACGPGVERLLEEAVATFPEARAMVVASDTVHGPAAAQALMQSIRENEFNLVIGTQILAKGHNFPSLTLVGVIDADLGLSGGDLRASERTYQLLTQVAGRAGRGEKPGRALLQTYNPEHPVIEALVSGDRDRFIKQEMDERERASMPPFGRLVALIVSGGNEQQVIDTAQALARIGPRAPDIRVLGPAPAPLRLLRGRFRWRLLMHTRRAVNASAVVREWLANAELPNAVRVAVDVDPYSFL
ncbi:MAG: primosomal protein N' [Alphaproteobacteria bacterium]